MTETWTVKGDSFSVPGFHQIVHIDNESGREASGLAAFVKPTLQSQISLATCRKVIQQKSLPWHTEISSFHFKDLKIVMLYSSSGTPQSAVIDSLCKLPAPLELTVLAGNFIIRINMAINAIFLHLFVWMWACTKAILTIINLFWLGLICSSNWSIFACLKVIQQGENKGFMSEIVACSIVLHTATAKFA
jgi:hypothetical protein